MPVTNWEERVEQVLLWVTIFGIIVIPLVGWLINTLITKKIDALEDKQKDDRDLFFKKLDQDRENVENHYVRSDLYEQAMKNHSEKNDTEFKNLINVVNTQFSNMENKLTNHSDKNDAEFKSLLSIVNTQFLNMEHNLNNTDEKIDELKEFITDKFHGNKN